MHTHNQVSLENIFALSGDEKKLLSVLIDALHSRKSDSSEYNVLITSMASYPLRLICALSENNSEINAVLNRNEYLNNTWKKMLDRLGYPSHPILAFDRKSTISTFSILKGAYLLNVLGQHPNLESINSMRILNKACECGVYQAIVMRLNYQLSRLKNNTSGGEVDEVVVGSLLHDANKLSSFYWSAGNMDSGLVLFDLATYLISNEIYRNENERFFMQAKTSGFSWQSKNVQCPFAVSILMQATENLYLAYILNDFTESKKISDNVTLGKGLLAMFDSNIAVAQDLQAVVISKLKELSVPLVESFCLAAYKNAQSKVEKQYPGYDFKGSVLADLFVGARVHR